ncbi:hypothetical protein Tcan_03244 [Toxocara canis]|uniref:Uncharacterized protein n=1 Tax=Toxocara canis TaxID=6265 RepID=A0A0B2W2X4_TOXCA|nr:hypothetical protein Tcan_03244 [Toxocara canis]
MYSAHGAQRRGLLRPYAATHGGPVFRNLPLFGFLASLVLFFYIFYVYQAQNAELNLMREQLDVQRKYASTLKAENVEMKVQLEKHKDSETALQAERSLAGKKLEEMKVQLEKHKDSETALQAERSLAGKKLEECNNNLRSEKLRADNGRNDLAKLQAENAKCSTKLSSAQLELLRVNETMIAMRTVGVNNEAVVSTLNDTISQLRAEIARLKGSENVQDAVHSAKGPIQDVKPASNADAAVVPQIVPVNAHEQNKVLTVKEDVQAAAAAGQALVQQSSKDNEKVTVALVGSMRDNAHPQQHLDAANVGDVMGMDRPVGPGDRVKLEDRKNQQVDDDGRLVVPGGEYAHSPEEGGVARRNNEAAPDFENDEKRVNEPDV